MVRVRVVRIPTTSELLDAWHREKGTRSVTPDPRERENDWANDRESQPKGSRPF